MNQLSKFLKMPPSEINRRRFLKQAGLSVFVTGLNASLPLPAWAKEGLIGKEHEKVFNLEYRDVPKFCRICISYNEGAG